MRFDLYPELTGLTNDDILLIWDSSESALKSVKISILKAFLGVTETPSGTLLKYLSNGDSNGLFYFLGTSQGTAQWSNPAGNAVTIVASSIE